MITCDNDVSPPHKKNNLGHGPSIIMNAKALSIMRYQNDINTEHNMKSIGRTAVAQ